MKTNLAKNSVKNNFHIPKACLHVKSICKSTHFFFWVKFSPALLLASTYTVHTKLVSKKIIGRSHFAFRQNSYLKSIWPINSCRCTLAKTESQSLDLIFFCKPLSLWAIWLPNYWFPQTHSHFYKTADFPDNLTTAFSPPDPPIHDSFHRTSLSLIPFKLKEKQLTEWLILGYLRQELDSADAWVILTGKPGWEKVSEGACSRGWGNHEGSRCQ